MAGICFAPHNYLIYKALLAKADSYPPEKPYQAAAYRKAAIGLTKYKYRVFDDITQPDEEEEEDAMWHWMKYIDGVGPKIAKFILDYIKTTPNTFIDTHCVVPQNEPIYKALREKFHSYEPEMVWELDDFRGSKNYYKAEAYRKAAAFVSLYPTDIIQDYLNGNRAYWLLGMGRKTRNFVYGLVLKQIATAN